LEEHGALDRERCQVALAKLHMGAWSQGSPGGRRKGRPASFSNCTRSIRIPRDSTLIAGEFCARAGFCTTKLKTMFLSGATLPTGQSVRNPWSTWSTMPLVHMPSALLLRLFCPLLNHEAALPQSATGPSAWQASFMPEMMIVAHSLGR
jgi:hypothetical protein